MTTTTITLYELYFYEADADGNGHSAKANYPEPEFYRHEAACKRECDARNAGLLAAKNANATAAYEGRLRNEARAAAEHEALVAAGLRTGFRKPLVPTPHVPLDKLGRWDDKWLWDSVEFVIVEDES